MPCKNCIYGAILIDRGGGEIQKFKIAEKFVNGVRKEINYKKNEVGCRAAAFQSKEDVCLNNHFSEFRAPLPFYNTLF